MEADPNRIHMELLKKLRNLDSSVKPFISRRTKRASVALIIRVRPYSDPFALEDSILVPHTPKIPKTKKKKKTPPNPSSTSSLSSTSSSSSPSTSSSHSDDHDPSPSTSHLHTYEPDRPPFDWDGWLSQSWVSTGELELLYIKRAANPTDRWSGQVAFPGGRQEPGETDYGTAVREVKEEIGLDLSDRDKFRYLFRLNDRHIDPYGKVKPLNVCSFVFLQICPITPAFALDPREVSAVIFTPFAFFGAMLPPNWTPSPSTSAVRLPRRFLNAFGSAGVGRSESTPPSSGASPEDERRGPTNELNSNNNNNNHANNTNSTTNNMNKSMGIFLVGRRSKTNGIYTNNLKRVETGRWTGSPLPWKELNYVTYSSQQTKEAVHGVKVVVQRKPDGSEATASGSNTSINNDSNSTNGTGTTHGDHINHGNEGKSLECNGKAGEGGKKETLSSSTTTPPRMMTSSELEAQKQSLGQERRVGSERADPLTNPIATTTTAPERDESSSLEEDADSLAPFTKNDNKGNDLTEDQSGQHQQHQQQTQAKIPTTSPTSPTRTVESHTTLTDQSPPLPTSTLPPPPPTTTTTTTTAIPPTSSTTTSPSTVTSLIPPSVSSVPRSKRAVTQGLWVPFELTFPCLHLAGVGVDATGSMFVSYGSSLFLLWGFTLRTTSMLFRFLDIPYMDQHLKLGMAQRRRNLNMYYRYSEFREKAAKRYAAVKEAIQGKVMGTIAKLTLSTPPSSSTNSSSSLQPPSSPPSSLKAYPVSPSSVSSSVPSSSPSTTTPPTTSSSSSSSSSSSTPPQDFTPLINFTHCSTSSSSDDTNVHSTVERNNTSGRSRAESTVPSGNTIQNIQSTQFAGSEIMSPTPSFYRPPPDDGQITLPSRL